MGSSFLKSNECKTVLSLNKDWQFCIGNEWSETKAENVTLPHSVELTPANSSGCRNYQGPCIYRKNLYVPSEYSAKKIFFRFEGAMGVSTLSVNGKEIKSHYCGYTPFVIDLTNLLNVGENNVIQMDVDNSDNPEVPPGKPQAELDFTYEGGIYRDAYMIVCDPLYITEPLLVNEVAGGGIFVHYSDVSESSAKVYAKIHVMNEYADKKDFVLTVSLVDADSNIVGEYKKEGALESNQAGYYEDVIEVEKPNLWSIDTPYLYCLKATVSVDGEPVYIEQIDIGIRTFEFTLEDGVLYNGKSHRFNGVNYHQTWPYIGNGVPTNLLERDIRKLKEMGAENIRSHYPFSSDFVNACDRLGMTLIVSNPGWQFCERGIFLERAVQNVRDIVRWQRNNPSILIWEPILNESKMGFEIQDVFCKTVHEEYPYSPCYTGSDWGPSDILYKEYDPVMLGTNMEKYGLVERKDDKPKPRWVREYADCPDNFEDQNTVWRCRRAWGENPMVEAVNRLLGRYQYAQKGVSSYLGVSNNKYNCGYGIWPGIAHNRGYHLNPCYGGHLDLFRVPKFSYYFMKSQQDREKIGDMIYIASWWCEASPSDVTVFSNANKVKLYVDGELVGEQTPDDVSVAHPPFTFKDIKRNFRPRVRSELKAVAIVDGKEVAEDVRWSPGVPQQLKLEADLCGVDLKTGGDIVAVRCYMMDNYGTVVPYTGDTHPIKLEVTGEGELVGDMSIGANPVVAEVGVATVLVKTKNKAGKIRIKADMLWNMDMNTTRCHYIFGDELVLNVEE